MALVALQRENNQYVDLLNRYQRDYRAYRADVDAAKTGTDFAVEKPRTRYTDFSLNAPPVQQKFYVTDGVNSKGDLRVKTETYGGFFGIGEKTQPKNYAGYLWNVRAQQQYIDQLRAGEAAAASPADKTQYAAAIAAAETSLAGLQRGKMYVNTISPDAFSGGLISTSPTMYALLKAPTAPEQFGGMTVAQRNNINAPSLAAAEGGLISDVIASGGVKY